MAVLIVGISGAIFVGRELWWGGMMVCFVLGHFFIFCNVFRIARMPELIWAATFTLLCGSTMLYETPGWTQTFLISLGLTILLIGHEMKKPSYHGIGWRKINPGLEEWWRENAGTMTGK